MTRCGDRVTLLGAGSRDFEHYRRGESRFEGNLNRFQY
jgi:hypothetical protein